MRTVLAAETLKTGEHLTIECVLAPDALREDRIRPFLAHKPSNYRAHIEAAFRGECDDLETRFYIGLLDDIVVGTIMTVETGGVGILGHVHTREDQRRKGICDAMMRHQMADFRQRNGHVLLLGTGYRSPAYHIYETHGFHDWPEGRRGCMRYDAEPREIFEARHFAPVACTPVPAQWKHWPLVALLAAMPASPYLRSLTLNVWGPTLLEGPYSRFLCEHGNRSETRAVVLESKIGAVVACATCIPDSRWPGVQLLDMFAHSSVDAADFAMLLESLSLSDGRIQCYADTRDAEKIAALESVNFERVAILPGQYRESQTWQDVWLYTRA